MTKSAFRVLREVAEALGLDDPESKDTQQALPGRVAALGRLVEKLQAEHCPLHDPDHRLYRCEHGHFFHPVGEGAECPLCWQHRDDRRTIANLSAAVESLKRNAVLMADKDRVQEARLLLAEMAIGGLAGLVKTRSVEHATAIVDSIARDYLAGKGQE